MLLTKRSGDIIRVLIRFPQDKPITTAIISDELHISSRSIQRELPTVEKWLTAKGFRFVRKRSVGLFLDEPDDRRRELLTLLDATGTDIPSADDRHNRQRQLLHALLFAREPVKSLTFMDQFGISEGTLTSLFPSAEPCGIRLTDSSLMLPIKSVSGVIGLGEDVRKLEYTCGLCTYDRCYRRKQRG